MPVIRAPCARSWRLTITCILATTYCNEQSVICHLQSAQIDRGSRAGSVTHTLPAESARLRTASGTHAAACRSSIYGCLRPRLSVLPGRPAAECFVQDLAATPDDSHAWHCDDLLGAPGVCARSRWRRIAQDHAAERSGGGCGLRRVWVTAGFLWRAGRPGTAPVPGPWRCLRWLGARTSGPSATWCARPG